MEKFFQQKYLYRYIFAFLLLVAIFLRFYNFPFRYGLGDESVREAIIGLEGAREFQAPLVGGFSSAGPFTWGPWFYYQMIFASMLFPYDYTPWIYLSVASIFCVFMLYKIGEELEGRPFGFVLSFLGVLSPALIIAGTHLAFPNLVNIFALTSVWLFIRLIKHNLSYWWSFIFGIVLGIGINIHYQMGGLLILLAFLLFKYKKYIYFLSAALGVFVTCIPLLLFELLNHWFTLKNIMYYYFHGKDMIYVPNRWLFYLRDFWIPYWGDVIGVSNVVASIIICFFIVIFIRKLYKKNISAPLLLLVIAFGVNFLLFRYYWGERFFGYFNFLRPFVFIFTGYVIFQFYLQRFGRYLLFLIITAFSYLIIPKSLEMLSKDPYTIYMYDVVNRLEKKMPGDTFQVFTCTKSKKNMNAYALSLIFLLDYKSKLTTNGIPIGINSEGCIPLEEEGKMSIIAEGPQKAENIILLQSNNISILSKGGWRPVSFEEVYDNTTRWWIRENH